MINEINLASCLSNPAQRNWDHNFVMPEEHIDCLVQTVINSPTKQNETHYKVYYTTDSKLIYNIYYNTNHFTVVNSSEFTNDSGITPDDYNVRNSQCNANLLVIFCSDYEKNSRTMVHRVTEERKRTVNPKAIRVREKTKAYSVGVAAGELILAANLLDYRTGLTSAFNASDLRQFVNGDTVELLVGIGKPDPTKDRRQHEEVLNKEITLKERRTGADNEFWKFPTFKKDLKIERL